MDGERWKAGKTFGWNFRSSVVVAPGDVVGCRYGHRMLPPVPDTWPPVPDGLLDAAHRTALDALSLVRFERFDDVAGNYAGATFNCKRYLKAKALNR